MSDIFKQILSGVEKPRHQLIILLLAALREFKGARTKQEILGLIRSRGWFAKCPNDARPYPSQASPYSEPRSDTLIAWARKQCVESGLMENDGTRDAWEASTKGLNLIPILKRAIQQGECSVRPCFFWTRTFKKLIDPSYEPSEQDAERPRYLYEDDLPFWMKSVRGNETSRQIEELMATEAGRAILLKALQS